MKQTRRGFIISMGRIAIGSGLALVTGWLLIKEKVPGEPCSFDFICKNCKKISDCQLPEGIAYKNQHHRMNIKKEDKK